MRSQRPVLVLLAVFLWAALPARAPAQEQELHWRELAVTAHLDAEGRLRIEERQAMVFTGDWNGGKRSFALGAAQDVEVHGITRIDPATGEARKLVEGDLDQVDRYGWTDGNTLRWRSRLPNDPPFDGTEIVYVLDYTLDEVLVPRRGSYFLDHEFVFTDREGDIEHFSLDLTLDPVWKPAGPLDRHHEAGPLSPGEGFQVEAELLYQGEGHPAGAARVPPLEARLALFALALGAIGFLYLRFRRGEAARGRYDRVEAPADWDEAWLQENLFDLKAEEAGTLWDQEVGPPEVSALLARLVAEGKLESEVRPKRRWFGKDILVLRLKTPNGLDDFHSYERDLLYGLFGHYDRETDTEKVRERHKASGFDPAKTIEKDLRRKIAKNHPELREKPRRGGWRLTRNLALTALAVFVAEAVLRPSSLLALIWMIPLGLVFGVGLAQAVRFRKSTRRLDLASLRFVLPGLFVLAGCLFVATSHDLLDWGFLNLHPGLLGSLALALVPVAVFSSYFNRARTLESRETVHRRQLLGKARRMLKREIRRERPRLRDEWFPYLLAFGLQRQVDRWFRAFGGEARRGTGFGSGSAASSFGGGSGGGGWTGGGGAFGGAGATSSWAAAAAGMGAGVSAPSSSGGGGGGGGGSSSGGGGGGGW